MTHTPHELAADFPEFTDTLHKLKMTDAHFRRQAEDYHALNREIHRIESGDEAADQMREETLRKRRMALKDEIYARLRDHG
ncbi:YdcH family protein [Yunchengibacter salinarum]|uniref:YdcH family protein n=1 Tax=Yunchengibacter salinarum TaxID=3133399 RepID=UPI0035B6950D